MSDSVYRPKVLIVDDAPENVRLLNELLKSQCDRQFASNGEAALRVVAGSKPDLILLDVVMPGIDGYEVCRRLKADPATREIPVIFVTARNESEEETLGFSLGAVDYITKPFNVSVVRARVRTHLELANIRRELQEKNQSLGQERDLIQQIVTKMRESSRFEKKGIRTLETTVEMTAGDILLSSIAPGGVHHLLVGDFTGHGLPAAIGAPIVSYIFYRMTSEGAPLSEILQEINNELVRKLPSGIFMACAMVALDRSNRLVHLWNHGLPAPMLFRQHQLSHRFSSVGIPLGIRRNLVAKPVSEVTQPFHPMDRLFIYSDGVTEVRNEQKEMFGEERLAAHLQEMLNNNLPLKSLLEVLRQYKGSHNFLDDVTVLEVVE
ncbi:MAG: SpoIIE family protein phosphatase [Magnetococcales bacterium]|nr:SpoIIE family protein phosphatase [Magnetococcales bacterium]NGZ26967.1 SpoIIE family protein phosphatase [Magnetococcales bacterium]